MSDIYQKSLKLHQELQGKIEIKSKLHLKSKHELALVYTPGVAQACRVISKDEKQAKKLTLKANTVAVISDGSAVLGLGNIGPLAAIPVMEGKAMLFKEFANINAFPICLNTQDETEIVNTIKNIAPVFAAINLEDISAPRCFSIEKRLKEELDIPVMHDDQHGTATVVLAALINAIRVRNCKKEEIKIVISGAGSAGSAITDLLRQYGFKNIIVCDREGAIYLNRANLSVSKNWLASISNPFQEQGPLSKVIQGADAVIGVSAPGLINQDMIRSMANKAIVMALANPLPEIMPDEAKKAGAYIVATGRSDFPNQVNNVLAFPGIFKGAIDNRVKQITDKMLIQAAISLASLVENPSAENILPDLFDPQVVICVSQAIKD
ncbi:MAG: NADP-dependent malic enzyme [Clostridia bacterium]|nr:NADP-dependent malic enzyme [Clostridia bacterium]